MDSLSDQRNKWWIKTSQTWLSLEGFIYPGPAWSLERLAGPDWYSAAAPVSVWDSSVFTDIRLCLDKRVPESGGLIIDMFILVQLVRERTAGPWSLLKPYRPPLIGQNKIHLMDCCAVIGWLRATRAELLSTIILTLLLHILTPHTSYLASLSLSLHLKQRDIPGSWCYLVDSSRTCNTHVLLFYYS